MPVGGICLATFPRYDDDDDDDDDDDYCYSPFLKKGYFRIAA